MDPYRRSLGEGLPPKKPLQSLSRPGSTKPGSKPGPLAGITTPKILGLKSPGLSRNSIPQGRGYRGVLRQPSKEPNGKRAELQNLSTKGAFVCQRHTEVEWSPSEGTLGCRRALATLDDRSPISSRQNREGIRKPTSKSRPLAHKGPFCHPGVARRLYNQRVRD